MARTPGQAPGSGRSGEWDQSPEPLAGQPSGRSAFWVQRGHPGKDKASGKEQGHRAGAAGRRRWGTQRKRGHKEARGERGSDRGTAPQPPQPPQPPAAWTPSCHRVLPSPPQGAPAGGPAHGHHTRPPSLVGSTSTLRGSRSLTQARLAEASVAATQVTYSLGSSRFPLGRSCHRLFLGAALPLGQSLRPICTKQGPRAPSLAQPFAA